MRLTPKESEIQKAILEGLQAHKIFAFRLNTAAFKFGKRFFRAHSLGAGAADIVMFANYYVLWIECKTEKGKLSPQQYSFAAKVESEGHHYIVARSWDDVENWMKLHGIK